MPTDFAVDVAFDCLPLRSVGRLDAPLDASDIFRRRAQRIKGAIEQFGAERTYFLYNSRCVFRFANSEVHGLCRFEFEGVVRTDADDRRSQEDFLEVHLASETCGGIPPAAEAWLAGQVRRAVAIEFDRFLAAGQLATHSTGSGAVTNLAELYGLGGSGV